VMPEPERLEWPLPRGWEEPRDHVNPARR
jgi:hypothetical protein